MTFVRYPSILADMASRPSFVVLGGGTGTFMVLQALRQLPVDITAVLTMVDDGGSNRVLRDQFGLLPTSGICQCITALSDDATLLRDLFNYRYHQGEGLNGMRFGNLFLAAVTDIVGSQKAAIEETTKLLKVQGKILPISYDNVRLVATYEDGSEVTGEHHIDEPSTDHDGKQRIVGLRTEPTAKLSADAQLAIENADVIIMGPGDFYTNTVANFVIEGLPAALHRSPAKKIFLANLMTKYGETYNYSLQDFLQEMEKYYALDGLDMIVVNSNTQYPAPALELYKKEFSQPVVDDLSEKKYQNIEIVRIDLLADEIFHNQAGDNLKRSILRHDPHKLANWLKKQFLRQK